MGSIFLALITVVRALCLLLAGTAMSVMVLASTTSGSTRPLNPFVPYADVLLFESPDDFVQRGFDCQSRIVPKFAWHCSMNPLSGTFSEIRVNITYYGRLLSEVNFTVRENQLSIGDLVLLWGTPEVRGNAQYAELYWKSLHARVFVTRHDRRFSYFDPVASVSITSVSTSSSTG